MEFVELLANISWISIILFLVGIGLIVVEMFDPGFGFFGAFGVIALIICIFVTAETVMQGMILTAIFFVILVILFAIFLTLISKGRISKRLVLSESTSGEQGFSGTEDMQYLMGKTGVVMSVCRPAGNVDFDGVKLDVVSRGEFIEKGATVEVVEIEGNRIVVKAKP
jgi:membrane-bound ClpP family serine protease